MSRFRLWFCASLLLSAAAHAAPEAVPFPKPPGLVTRVDFWKRVYTEVDTRQGLLHDAEDLAVVYEVVPVPPGLSRNSRDARLEARRRHYRSILLKLAAGDRRNLDAEEQRVLALFPPDVSSRTLRAAASRIRFQLGQADKFRAGIDRMGRWEGFIRSAFAERGLPTELIAIPHVESSFNPEARSHVGASGIWQFMPATGRLFMRVDPVLDERNDPFLSSVAAARLFQQNYERLGSWPLAVTAYNHGPAGMARAVSSLGTRDIDVIVDRYKSRTFGFASQNFYSEFLAALEIERDPERYFGAVRKDPPENHEIVVLDSYYRAKTLADAFHVDEDDLRRANPALGNPVWRGQKHVPRGYALRVPADPMRAAPKVVLASIPASARLDTQTLDRTHRVQRGETLGRIAHRYGTSEATLVSLNGLRNRHLLRIGQVLKLPVRGGGPAEPRAAARPVAAATGTPPPFVPEPAPIDGVYRVQRGDTITSIARRFGVSEADLVAQNRIANRNRLAIGQVLQLPDGATSAGRGEAGVYTVRRGDTLDAIARRFGVTSSAIVAMNGITDARRILPGQRIFVPGADQPDVSSAP